MCSNLSMGILLLFALSCFFLYPFLVLIYANKYFDLKVDNHFKKVANNSLFLIQNVGQKFRTLVFAVLENEFLAVQVVVLISVWRDGQQSPPHCR